MKRKLSEKSRQFLNKLFLENSKYNKTRIITKESYYIKNVYIPKGSILEIAYPGNDNEFGRLVGDPECFEKYCSNCGNALPNEKVKECPFCGEKIENNE